MADSTITTTPIRNLIAWDCRAWGQPRSGIKDISVASKLMKSLTLVWVVFIASTLAISEFDSRFLHNHYSDPESDCGGLLVSAPAMQWYKVGPRRIKPHEIAVFCAGCIRYQAGDILFDGRLLHNHWMDFDALCGRLLGLTPAFQSYKVRLCRVETQKFAVFCGGSIRY